MSIKPRNVIPSVAAISVLLLAAGLYVYHFVALTTRKTAFEQAKLNRELDNLLRSELFITLGGVKPVSSADGTPETYKIIAKAVADGYIKNPDIKFFWCDKEIFLVSRNATARLTKDKTAAAVFKRYSLTLPQNATDWINEFSAICSKETTKRALIESDIILGIGYGYPPLEVEAFALDLEAGKKRRYHKISTDPRLRQLLKKAHVPVPDSEANWLKLWREAIAAKGESKKPLPWHLAICDILKNDKDTPRQFIGNIKIANFVSMSYVRFTNQELERDDYLMQAQPRLAENYDRLIRSGRTALEIINNPQWLKKDLPSFPNKLLEK